MNISKNRKIVISFLFLSIICLFLLHVSQVAAVEPLVPGSGDTSEGSKYTKGDYEVNDFVILALNVSKWILGIVGTLTLAMFIWGGFLMLVSAGSSDTVKKGKDTLIAAVIGLIVVFSSYLIIKFTLQALGVDWDGSINQPTQIQLN